MSKRKILLLVEGEKADIAVMCRLLTVYNLNIDYEIIPYCTNIYRLYKDFFDSGDDPENLDLLLLLKSRDKIQTMHTSSMNITLIFILFLISILKTPVFLLIKSVK